MAEIRIYRTDIIIQDSYLADLELLLSKKKKKKQANKQTNKTLQQAWNEKS